MLLLVCKEENLHIIKKEEHLISQVNAASKYLGLTLDQSWESVYIFITKTNRVESNKMIEMSFRTFIIKVLVFINTCLLSFLRMEGDTHIKCSKIIISNICLKYNIFLQKKLCIVLLWFWTIKLYKSIVKV